MGRPKKIVREYRLTEPRLHQASRTLRSCFIDDKADFIAFDLDFNDPYAADWLAVIEASENHPDARTLKKESIELAIMEKEALAACGNKFRDAKYFIRKAFPNKRARWNKFGFNKFEKVRLKPVLMDQFMRLFHSVAEEHKIPLIASGYSQARIDEIETLRAALEDIWLQHKRFIKEIPELTRDRYETNNKLWNINQRVCTAGKSIFKDNYAKYQKYLLPKEKKQIVRLKPELEEVVG